MTSPTLHLAHRDLAIDGLSRTYQRLQAQRLVELNAAAMAAVVKNRWPAINRACDALDAACEEYRREWHPDARLVSVAASGVVQVTL